MNILHLLLVSIVVGAPKRTRDEFENRESITEIAELVDSLAGRSGLRIPMLRSGQSTISKDKLLALTTLEVEAFQIILENHDKDVAETVELLNNHIDMNRRLYRAPFTEFHILVWRDGIMNSPVAELAAMIETDSQILTSPDNIEYIQISERIWELFIYPFLLLKIEREFPLMRMSSYRKPFTKCAAARLLTPLAREFVHQQMRIENFTGSLDYFPRFLKAFNTKSVLLRRLLDYYISVRSMGMIDTKAAMILRQRNAENASSMAAMRINEAFRPPNNTAMRVLYDEKRLSSLRQLGPLHKLYKSDGLIDKTGSGILLFTQENMNKFVLDGLRISYQPLRITAVEVVKEWEQLERNQVAGDSAFGAVETGIATKEWNPGFILPVGRPTQSETNSLSNNVKIQIINYALEFGAKEPLVTTGQNASTIHGTLQSLAMETNSDHGKILQYFGEITFPRYLNLEIAHEICRINKLRIDTDAVAVLRDAHGRGLQLIRATPESVVEFYNLMFSSMRLKGSIVRPFSVKYHARFGKFATHDFQTWKTYSVLPKLNALKNIEGP